MALEMNGGWAKLATQEITAEDRYDEHLIMMSQSDHELPTPNDVDMGEDMGDYGPPLAGEEVSNGVIRNDKPCPISKPPPKRRDYLYSWAFLLHFIAIFLLSLIEQKSLGDSLINYGRAGSWSSILMIVILVGSFLGYVA